jgi:multiple sugar transport system substrate-binding protein
MRRTPALLATVAVGSLIALTGCSGGGGSDENKVLKVAYQSTDAFTALNDLFEKIKPEFEEANPGVTVELQPIEAGDEDYKTRVALSHRSPDTAPDVFYEDTYNVRSDVEAGYLLNLDEYLAEWEDWSQFSDAAKAAGEGGDGIYAIPLGVDTRVIWYNKPILEEAGISTPWQPESWQDVLDAAAAVKETSPDVMPFNMYIGQGMGEATTTSTMLMLLHGTGDDIYDDESGKWIVGSQGLVDSLSFVEEIYANEYGTTVDEALDGNVWQTVLGELYPNGEIMGTIEGSYLPSFWQEGGSYEWPEYTEDLGVALWPTQDGSGDGFVSVSGGWSLALGAQSQNPDLAFDFMTLALSQENALAYDVQNSQIAVRNDVASEESYLSANPFVEAVTEAVEYTHFRPGTSDYPAVSIALQEATEAVVVNGQSPEEAAAAYDAAVIEAVGEENTTTR